MPATSQVLLAVDLGASSGRVVAGLFDGGRLALEEVYRFDNGGVPAAGALYWPIMNQWQHVQRGLRSAAKIYGSHIASVGVDTWGVDFGLLGRRRDLLGNPHHYRDRRTDGMLERLSRSSPARRFSATGLQFMELNSLYQLLAMKRAGSPMLDAAETLLFMPDLFHWLFTGVRKQTNSPSRRRARCYDPRSGRGATGLLERFGLPIAHPCRRSSRPAQARQAAAETSPRSADLAGVPGDRPGDARHGQRRRRRPGRQ